MSYPCEAAGPEVDGTPERASPGSPSWGHSAPLSLVLKQTQIQQTPLGLPVGGPDALRDEWRLSEGQCSIAVEGAASCLVQIQVLPPPPPSPTVRHWYLISQLSLRYSFLKSHSEDLWSHMPGDKWQLLSPSPWPLQGGRWHL